jgi:uncharacterized protein
VIRAQVMDKLRERLPGLQARYGITTLGLFGSVARDEEGPHSDVDLLVGFSGDPTFARYMGLKEELEALLERKVDLVTTTGLKARIRDRVLAELLDVA